jgi:hypothetical protein
MKTLFQFLLLIMPFFLNGQTIQYRMVDFTPFKFTSETTFWQALDANKVEFDSLKYHCNTLYTIDITNNVFSYVGSNGDSESEKMLDVTQTDLALMVEVPFKNKGTYHFLFGKNINGDTSLIIRNKELINGKTEGFFTNKVELIK